MSGTSIRCIFCSKYLISGTGPRQASCGDRLCEACFTKKGNVEVVCPVCGEIIHPFESFRDKAVENETTNLHVKCPNNGCLWEGLCVDVQAHENECRFGVVKCPNVGCTDQIQRGQVETHKAECSYQHVPCLHCSILLPKKDVQAHIDRDCPTVEVECKNKCGHKASRAKMSQHLTKECKLRTFNCTYTNCTYLGTNKQLQEHDKRDIPHHLRCLNQAVQDVQNTSSLISHSVSTHTDRIAAERERALSQMVSELTSKLRVLQDSVTTLEPTVFQLQEVYNEMGLTLQTLQAATYDGKFVWKVPEVLRRNREAKSGKTVSLYSAPFRTSRHGYKLCLRLYMNGDGTGKGTHLSFFITLMQGEYDALLPWPFRQAITLTLVDQNRQRDIIQSFRPEPNSSSFQRPRNEMNIATGCPTFAPISILDNSSYVKEDTMFLKCKVDLLGLESIY